MNTIDPIYVGANALAELLRYVQLKALTHFILVSDTHTYQALGAAVEQALQAQSYTVTSIVLAGDHIHADEAQLTQVLVRAPIDENYTFIAVGAGTITDIVRFVSHRTRRLFIAMPTAPSVDGFTSIGAPIILAGIKTTIPCQPPLAVVADIATLQAAPPRLIAAGFGDMLGKLTSLADWQLGSLLWNEPYDERVAERTRQAVNIVLENTNAIGQRTEAGIRALMNALIESGLCMLEVGNSRPASGAEHHVSHYWEMKRLKDGEATALHGEQVGYALTLIAAQYAKLRTISASDMSDRLEAATLPNCEQERATIRAGFGDMADDVARAHHAFLNQNKFDFEQLKRRIAEGWDEIQRIAAQVPALEVIADALRRAGAPTHYSALGLRADEILPGLQYGHYLRNRFTILKLGRILNIPLTD